MERDDMILAATAELDSLVKDDVIDEQIAQHLLDLLDTIVADDQPTPQITVNQNIGAVEANWLVHGHWAALMVDPDGFWSFWLEQPGGNPVYELDEREGDMTEDELVEVQRILGSLGGMVP